MAQSFDDLNLPNAIVTRIAKEMLPENCAISKEARTALAKAASVFVLYVTSASNSVATKHNRKTINGQDVLQAMAETDFGMLVGELSGNLEHFKKVQQEKKEAIMRRKQDKDEEPSSAVNMDYENADNLDDFKKVQQERKEAIMRRKQDEDEEPSSAVIMDYENADDLDSD